MSYVVTTSHNQDPFVSGMYNNNTILVEYIDALTSNVPIIALSPFNHAKYKRSFPQNSNKRYDKYRKILKINEMKTIKFSPKYIV